MSSKVPGWLIVLGIIVGLGIVLNQQRKVSSFEAITPTCVSADQPVIREWQASDAVSKADLEVFRLIAQQVIFIKHNPLGVNARIEKVDTITFPDNTTGWLVRVALQKCKKYASESKNDIVSLAAEGKGVTKSEAFKDALAQLANRWPGEYKNPDKLIPGKK